MIPTPLLFIAREGPAHALINLVEYVGDSPEGLQQLVPVCIHLLSPDKIPPPRDTDDNRLAVFRAIISLGALRMGYLSSGRRTPRHLSAAVDRHWVNIWTWIEFLATNCVQKTVFGPEAREQALVTIFGACLAVLESERAGDSSLIATVAKIWVLESRERMTVPKSGIDGLNSPAALFHLLHRYWGERAFELDVNTEPYTESLCGTSAEDLAEASMAHLHHSMRRRDVDRQDTVDSLQIDLPLIRLIVSHSRNVIRALVKVRIIPLLMDILGYLAEARFHEPSAHAVLRGIGHCLTLLTLACMVDNTISPIRSLIDLRLLPILLRTSPWVTGCTKDKDMEPFVHSVFDVFDTVLSTATFHPRVLRDISRSFKEIKADGTYSLYRTKGPLASTWLDFEQLVAERHGIARRVRAHSEPIRKCANASCTMTGYKTWFMRCAGCDTLFCSIACQRHAWKRSHRVFCLDIQGRRKAGKLSTLSKSEINHLLFMARTMMLSSDAKEVQDTLAPLTASEPPFFEVDLTEHPPKLFITISPETVGAQDGPVWVGKGDPPPGYDTIL